MTRVYIYCEGQTEESFVDKVLYPYFLDIGIIVVPIVCQTKRTAVKKYRGGVRDYAKIRKELTMLCRQHRSEYVTTMFDYFAMPENTPGIASDIRDLYERMEAIESAIDADIGEANCHFHFMVHEFEGILFSRPESFRLIADDDVVSRVRKIRDSYPTPEHIDDSPETAPSKRLEALIPRYAKIINGSLLSIDMGLDVIMGQCPYFRKWIAGIAAMGTS